LSRYGAIARIQIRNVKLEQVTRFYMKGSALTGTMRGGPLGLETVVHVESDEPPERVRTLIRMGEQTCFTLQSLIQPVPVRTTVTLNGRPLALDEAAAGPVTAAPPTE